nr:ELWxxDGT repeat protein [Myxococcus sp. CA040A]
MNIQKQGGRSASVCSTPASGVRGLFLLTLLTLGAGCGPEATEPWAPKQEPGPLREALDEGPAFLVKDINTSTPANVGSNPKHFVALGGALYFAADSHTSGEELWRTDGTSAGTALVADLCSGPCGSNPRGLTVMNEALYFFASNSHGALGLWRSDGTVAGTQMLKAININNFSPKLTPINGTLYFSIYDPASGNELWTSDGTAVGTKMLVDINPGTGDSYPSGFLAFNGTVYFRATSGVGAELWATDGTAAGTAMRMDLYPGTNGSAPAELTVYNDMLYFIASDAPSQRSLFKSNGTAAGTVKVKEFRTVGAPLLFNGLMYFPASDTASGYELWKSDGTTAGTLLAVDVFPGSATSNISNINVVGGSLFFTAYDSTATYALWQSDGTQAGTQRLLTAPSNLNNVNVLGGSVYFSAREASTGSSVYTELWVSDLTAAGTRVVKDINPGTSLGAFSTLATSYFGILDGVLYFGANDGVSNTELWRSDGTAAGTTQVKDLFGPVSESSPANLVVSNGRVFFTANEGSHGAELWESNGTATGTRRYWDICTGSCSPTLSSFTLHGSSIFYITTTNSIGGSSPARLMRSPTSSGTAGAIPVASSLTVTSPRLVSYKNWLYFRANDTSYGDILRMTDGSYTTQTSDTAGRGLRTPDQMVVSNGTLFFTADDGTSLGTELYKTDGTYSGSTRVKDIWPGVNSSSPSNLTDVNGTLFFRAQDGTGAYNQLWKSDGTSTGTVKVATFLPATGGALTNFRNMSGTLFFFVSDYTTTELWKSDGTSAGTVKVKDLPVRSYSESTYFATMGGALYFGLRDDAHGYELWKSDGTAAGTDILVDLRPGPNGGLATQSYNNGALVSNLLPLAEGRLLFSASDGETGMELWMTDGSAAGTVRLTDLAPGDASSTPTSLTRAGTLVYFAANDGGRGRELWALRVADIMDSSQTSGSKGPTP